MTQKIDPQYVRFDTAKLLKEKGFANIQIDYGLNQMLNQSNPPEQWQVVEWLRVNHSIWIYTSSHEVDKWCYHIGKTIAGKISPRVCENGFFGLDDYDTPQEATEAGILYVLNDLI